MKFFKKMKDGGPESTSTGYWLVEIKKAFSIVLLRFDGKSREAFHTHAFNCFSWVVKGKLKETLLEDNMYSKIERVVYHPASWIPFITRRSTFHMVDSLEPTSWVLSFRGPWIDAWKEWLPNTNETVGLTHGRIVTSREAAQA